MSAPRLPAVDRLAVDLAEKVVNGDPGPDAIWAVSAPGTAGKSTLLAALAVQLEKQEFLPILVTPAIRSLDAAPVAVVQIGAALRSGGEINGHFDTLTDAKVPWAQKLASIRDWLNRVPDRVVLLCDEPFEWAVRSDEDIHFAEHAEDLNRVLFGSLTCRRVVSGRVSAGQETRGIEHLQAESAPEAWLSDADEWGPLCNAASNLGEVVGSALQRFSPLEIRLLVGLAAITSPRDVASWVSELDSRREISRRLAQTLSGDSSLRPVRDVWAKLSLVRKSFGDEVLFEMGAGQLEALPSAILRQCILYYHEGQYRLHERLRADARFHGWLTPSEARETHRRLAGHYTREFQQMMGKHGDLGAARLAEMEAYHHVTQAADIGLAKQLTPFFVDQLDALGRALSRSKQYEGAVWAFSESIKWNDANDYAHHYLAFNLDVEGRDPQRVSTHYTRAITLDPDNPWWRSRWINFLVTRGRIAEARRAWDDALDALGLPGPDADPGVYENLHLWVARMLLHRGHLDFAAEVLRGIPPDVRERHAGLSANERRLAALLEAQRTGALVPGPFLKPEWWRHGPYLLQATLESGHRLVSWYAGRIDAVREGELALRVAEVQEGAAQAPVPEALRISFREFDALTLDIKARKLEAGRFIEIGRYVKAKNSVERRIRVHQVRPWLDDELPPLFPDPARYLRRDFARTPS